VVINISAGPAVIINASSGADDKRDAVALLRKLFDEHGLDARISLATSGEEIIELTKKAIADNRDPIVAGGGDGTINAVASLIVDTDHTLGVLPLGTLNHFAKDLDIPPTLEDSARVLLDGNVMQVDVGEVNDSIFLNNSSLGLYPRIVRHREKQQERLGRGKWPAFVWAAISVLRRYPFLDVRLQMNGEELKRRTPFVFIGNNEYRMEGLDIDKREWLDRGVLSLYVAHRTGRWGLVRLAWRALWGRLRDEVDFDALTAKEIKIETKRNRIQVATDGEVNAMQTPLEYRIRPRALRVIVPAVSDKLQFVDDVEN
jgi:diacylglycerol kinase family enzyme